MFRHWLYPAFALIAFAAAWGADLPRNPGFEQVREGTELPADWSERGLGTAINRLTPAARTGRWAAQITTTEPMAGYYYSHPEPLPAARHVTVSAWVRVAASQGGAYIILYYLHGDKLEQYLSPRRQSERIGDTRGQWRRVTINDVPPPEAQDWRMSLEFDGVGTAPWDNVAATVELVAPLPGIVGVPPMPRTHASTASGEGSMMTVPLTHWVAAFGAMGMTRIAGIAGAGTTTGTGWAPARAQQTTEPTAAMVRQGLTRAASHLGRSWCSQVSL